MIIKAVKKPIEISAIKWDGTQNTLYKVLLFMGQSVNFTCRVESDYFDLFYKYVQRDGLKIKTLEGDMIASVGDYIIKGVNGEFYPCKPDIFEKSYDIIK